MQKSRPTRQEYEAKSRELLQYLIGNIHSGQWPIDTLLPTETELGERSQLSRTSVRKTLDELQKLGYIERKRGHGTKVIRRHSNDSPHDGSKHIGLVYPIYLQHAKRVQELHDNIIEDGGTLSVYNITDDRQDPEKERQFLSNLTEHGCEAVAIFPSPHDSTNENFYQNLRQRGVKVALLSPHQMNMSHCVSFVLDERLGAYLATQHLIQRGAEFICQEKLSPLGMVDSEREDGARRACLEAGIPFIDVNMHAIDPQRRGKTEQSMNQALNSLPSGVGGLLGRSPQTSSQWVEHLKTQQRHLHIVSCCEDLLENKSYSEFPHLKYPIEQQLMDVYRYFSSSHSQPTDAFQRRYAPTLTHDS